MRSSLLLRQIVRNAVLDALAVSCVLPLVQCGGSVQIVSTQDASATDSPIPEQDGSPDRDARVYVDAEISYIDSAFSYVEAGPDHTDDSGCARRTPNACGSVVLACLPPGLVPGQNNGPACAPECGSNSSVCQVTALSAGAWNVQCLCGGGRFPAGLALAETGQGTDPVGLFLAEIAALEAAAVLSFKQLARELVAHGAPASLVVRAHEAARQEIVHARLFRTAAKKRGCSVPRLRVERLPARARSLLVMAKENAVEGCGRETLGAAVLALQSHRAEDPTLRPILARVADDELEHAALSWDIQAWLVPQLDEASRAEVSAARRAFLDACEKSEPPRDSTVREAVGWPSPEAWETLVSAVRDGVGTLAA